MMMVDELKSYVEEKIFKNYMVVGNLTIDEFKIIDDYCKNFYADNRKQMLLDLIRYKEENSQIIILNDKIDLVYSELDERLERVENYLNNHISSQDNVLKQKSELLTDGLQEKSDEQKEKKVIWKGLTK